MPVRPRPVAVLALALGALLLLAGCGGSGDTQTTPAPQAQTPGRTLTVVATTNVWGSVASAVAGPGVEVRSIIQDPAADPHSYESTPADAAAINLQPDAQLWPWHGLNALQAWNSSDRIVLAVTRP